MLWEPASFLLAQLGRPPCSVEGYVYRNLGLHMAFPASPKGRRPPTWTLTHLGSGHTVENIKGYVKDAFPIATEIAECGDWSFDGLYGWKNVDPELPEKTTAIINRHAAAEKRKGPPNASDKAARAVAQARLA